MKCKIRIIQVKWSHLTVQLEPRATRVLEMECFLIEFCQQPEVCVFTADIKCILHTAETGVKYIIFNRNI